MSNPLQNPTVQHFATSVGAIVAGVVLPSYLPEGWTITAAAAGAVSGLGGNLVSNFVARFFDRRAADPTRSDVNSDLLRLVGDAVAREIAECARQATSLEQAERKRVEAFATQVSKAFVALIEKQELPDITSPDVKQLLVDAAANKTLPPVETLEYWQRLVARLNRDCEAGLEDATEQLLAQRLHTHLWDAIRSELKKDFTADGRAYAALHLNFMGDVLATLRAMQQTQLTQEEHAFLSTAVQHLEQTIIRLETMEAAAERRHQEVLGETQELKAMVSQLLAQAPQRLHEQESGQIEELRTQNEELRAQLEAALQRAAQAETTGDEAASEALTELRQKGDPKALGAFLDQQLEEKLPDVIELLRERAAVAYVSGEITRAEQCLHQILATYPDDLDATNQLGHVYLLRGDLDAASKQYQQLLEVAPNDETAKAVALGNLGGIALTEGQLDEAERLSQEALTIYQQLGSLEGQATALGNLGLIAQTRGQLDEAERLHRKALTIHQRLGKLEGQAAALSNLGGIAQTRGQLDEAERLHRKALTIYQQLGSLEGQATALGNLGLIARTRGQLDEAERLHRKALTIHQRLGSLKGQANQLGNLGLIARTRGQLEEAERLFREAFTINQQLGLLEGQAKTLGNLGEIARTRGDLAEAERLHRDSLAINKQLGRLEGQAFQLVNLGLVAKQRGNLMEARRLWTEARDLFTRVGAKPQQEQAQRLLDALTPG